MFWSVTYSFIKPIDVMTPDSQGYIDFDWSRTVGYPIFLWIFKKIFGGFSLLPFVQLGLGVWSCSILAKRVSDFTKSHVLGIIVLLGCVGNPAWMKFHFQILSESPTVILLTFILADLILFVKEQKKSILLRIGALIGMAMLVRPTSVIWIFGVWGCIFFLPQVSRIKIYASTLIPIIVCMVIGNGIFYAHHGHFKSHMMTGHNMIGKLGIWATLDTPSKDSQFMAQAVKDANTKKVRNILQKCHTIGGYNLISSVFYDEIRFYNIKNTILHMPSDLQNKLKDPFFYDQFMTERSYEILKSHWSDYLMDSLKTYIGIITIPALRSSNHMNEVKIIVKDNVSDFNSPSIQENVDLIFEKKIAPDFFIFLIRALLISTNILGFFLLILCVVRRIKNRSTLLLIPLSGAFLIIQCTYVAIALTQAPLSRYILPMWPCLLVYTVMGYAFIKDEIKNVKH